MGGNSDVGAKGMSKDLTIAIQGTIMGLLARPITEASLNTKLVRSVSPFACVEPHGISIRKGTVAVTTCGLPSGPT